MEKELTRKTESDDDMKDREEFLPDTQEFLPDTQELVPDPEELSETEQLFALTHWGVLIPTRSGLTPVKLQDKHVRFGRSAKECDIDLNTLDIPVTDPPDQNLHILRVSKKHFEVFMEKRSVDLIDCSTNGTFLNQLKLVNGNKQHLRNGDVIGILKPDFSLYKYISPNGKYSDDVCHKYFFGEEKGEGSTSVVYEGWRRSDLMKVAIKVIDKTKWPTKYSSPTDFMEEVNILKDLDHPGIIKVIDVVETDTRVYIVMEFAEGGELFDQVQGDSQQHELKEEVAKFQLYQICSTIVYLHSKQVCHRDLKLENLLLDRKDSKGQIKVSDFGLSKVSNDSSFLESYVGTPVYMAPEVISVAETHKIYTLKSDCWSLGVILYTLLSGTQPFSQSLEEKILHELIMTANYAKMRGSRWEKVSETAKELVGALLVVDPTERLSAEEILEHEWFTRDPDLCKEAKNVLFSGKPLSEDGQRTSVGNISNNLACLSVEEIRSGLPVKKRAGSLLESTDPAQPKRMKPEADKGNELENLSIITLD